MGKILFGVILGVLLVPVLALVYFKVGHPPVAVADKPFPMEALITQIPLQARINSEMPGNPPVAADEGTLLAGAEVYRDQCAACHGFNGKASQFGGHMFPGAPPLWEKHPSGNVVGVSDDPPGETYWKVANGIRLTGMPAFRGTLSETEIWQVTVLLANADKPLPPDVLAIVRGELSAPTPQPPSTSPTQ